MLFAISKFPYVQMQDAVISVSSGIGKINNNKMEGHSSNSAENFQHISKAVEAPKSSSSFKCTSGKKSSKPMLSAGPSSPRSGGIMKKKMNKPTKQKSSNIPITFGGGGIGMFKSKSSLGLALTFPGTSTFAAAAIAAAIESPFSSKMSIKRRQLEGKAMAKSKSRPNTSCGVISGENVKASGKKRSNNNLLENHNNKDNAEMLQHLLKAIEFTKDDLSTISLCRLLQDFVKQCKTDVAHWRLQLCTKMDATSHCLRAIRARLQHRHQQQRQQQQIYSDLEDLCSLLAVDTIARTLLCVAGKDRKFLLKIRLNGMLPVLANLVLLHDDLDVPPQTPSSSQRHHHHQPQWPSINLLRLTARCLKSIRNAQLLGRERNFAERFVCTLNAACAFLNSPNLIAVFPPASSTATTSTTMPLFSQLDGMPLAKGDAAGIDDELLLAIMLENGIGMNGTAAEMTAPKMARLMECLFFLTKHKWNKVQLLDHHCLPVLKTIFETHFQKRAEELIHQEIALIALASLRQFAKTKKGREKLISMSTLDMCERFIGELAQECQQFKNDKATPAASGRSAIHHSPSSSSSNPNAQLQDSLCALCLRCLPAQPFPYRLNDFPFNFELPSLVMANKVKNERQRRVSSPNIANCQKKKVQKNGRQKNADTKINNLPQDEDATGQSSDEDYGFWSAAGGSSLDMAAMAEDSMMSCSGLIGDGTLDSTANNSLSIGLSEGDNDEEEENGNLLKNTEKDKSPPLGSSLAVQKYSRLESAELIANYEKFFTEFCHQPNQFGTIYDEFSAALTGGKGQADTIQSHEQIVFGQNKPKSVIPFVKIAFPELFDCGDQQQAMNGTQMSSIGNAKIEKMPKRREEDNSSPITATPEAMRQLIVKKAKNLTSKSNVDGHIPERRVVFDLNKLVHQQAPSVLGNNDVQRLGKIHAEHLQFESRFESGNLWKAVQVGPTEYELVLSPDVNQHSPHFQWFHFEVSGMRAGVPYTFELVNCQKSVSMFSRGMQPVLFSVAEAVRNGCPGWCRAGSQISYFRNLYSMPNDDLGKENGTGTSRRKSIPLHRTRSATVTAKTNGNAKENHQSSDEMPSRKTSKDKDKSEGRNFFSLRFTLQFRHDGDICYIAYHFPYTYTRLQSTLERWISSSALSSSTSKGRRLPNIHVYLQQLCHSLAGVPVPLLTITDTNHHRGPIEPKQLILISARVHPGEANSSWIMHGLIQFLLSAHPLAQRARELFIFKLIPMLNPDGVINGSHRCSLAGQDLNRVWNDPSPVLHPTIFHAKELIQYAVDVLNRPPFVFIDLHGHSRKANIFMYGNNPEESWRQSDHRQQQHQQEEEPKNHIPFSLLPEILDKISDSFALKDCAFSITKPKEYSARVACWRQFHLERVYTMESSYWGFDQGPKAGSQITIGDLKRIGAELVEALIALHDQQIALSNPKMAPMEAAEKQQSSGIKKKTGAKNCPKKLPS